MNATYSPDDNKLRLYPDSRLPKELYERVRKLGFRWAPKQELFVAPAWTPGREDLLIELCGEIGDEDTSLVDRAEERAERFEEYSDKREHDAQTARAGVEAIAGQIPLGQPILIGHHSQRRAERDRDRIHEGMRKAVTMWKRSEYWADRAKGALAHAKYKEIPAVRARRIKKLEAELRGCERSRNLARDPDKAHYQRWVDHLQFRLEYERAMLQESGGIVTDRKAPEKGGAIQCLFSPGYGQSKGWSPIVKVNKVTVTIHDCWRENSGVFTRTISFDDIRNIMTKAEVDAATAEGRIIPATGKPGFYLKDTPVEAPKPREEPKSDPAFEAMEKALETGIQTVVVDELFETPPTIVYKMLRLADLKEGDVVLEPSAGRGAIATRIPDNCVLIAVELNAKCVDYLKRYHDISAMHGDFLNIDPAFWKQERVPITKVIMNPPFSNGQDIRHTMHAFEILAPGGRLVGIMSEGPFFRSDRLSEHFRKWLADRKGTSIPLEPGAFKESGTMVKTRIVVIDKEK